MNYPQEALKRLLDFLFPKTAKVVELEKLKASEILKLLPPALETGDEHLIAIFDYQHPLTKELIWELKYRGNRILAKKLAEIILDVIKHELAERALFEHFVDPILIPVPMSEKRRYERGWNQTEILGEEIKLLDTNKLLKYLPRQLVKFRHTESQTQSGSKKERLANLKGSMKVLHPPAVAGRCVILLDDVSTTGSTFTEAKRALKEAGAKKILCVAVGH